MNNIGKIIYGYCNGFFGRDDYEDKIIVYETELSICCRYLDSPYRDYLTCTNFDSVEEKQEYIEEWSKKSTDI